MNIRATSIVRDGNHFIYDFIYTIRYQRCWILIDGPWFELLERFKEDTNCNVVQIATPFTDIFEIFHYTDNSYLDALPRRFVSWTRFHWRPQRKVLQIRGIKYHPVWLCDQGILPAHLDSREFKEILLDD